MILAPEDHEYTLRQGWGQNLEMRADNLRAALSAAALLLSSGTPIGLPQRQSTPLAAALDTEWQDSSSTDDQRNTVTSTEVENEITQLQRTVNSELNSAETSTSQVNDGSNVSSEDLQIV